MMKTEQQKRSTTVEDVLIGWGELKFREHSLGRDGEEREWQENALFYQRRQWLEWNDTEQRFTELRPDKRKPRPMPVSNYYAKTINANANQLGAQLVRVIATPKNDDPQSRRAADYAQMGKEAIDQESNLKLLVPLLAKHTALWGMGVLKDEIDTTEDPSTVEEQEVESTKQCGCLDCGQVTELGGCDPDEDTEDMQEACPNCGSMNTSTWVANSPTTVSEYQTGKGKIKTRVCPVFEVYLPREVQNANLAPHIVHRYRKSLSAARRTWGDRANDVQPDKGAGNKSETRMDSLRQIGAYNWLERSSSETCTITEVWTKWDELPKKLQEAIERELSPENDDMLGMDDPEMQQMMPEQQQDDTLQRMKAYGLFFIYSGTTMLQWGPNPFVDPDTDEPYFPYTFFLWDVDPASVYPKGVGCDLVPLQKRLNRLDSLIELAMMTNAAGKWIWPTTQGNKRPPTGDPSDVVEFDPIGDGKSAPQFVQPSPFHGQVWQYRAAILQDFQQLGLTLGIMEGNASSQSAFRTVAYLGAKAAEQLNTQRYLWESAHCMHYKKTLAMAKWVWDEERQVKIAGPNGRMLYETFTGDDLRGDYEIDFVPDSSIPRTQEEKVQMMQQLIMAQLLDISDPQTRQYLYDIINLEGLNLAGELQFRKAERDLEAIKRGEMPPESPYQDWQIALKVTANFTLTEEFEALDPQLQSYIIAYCEYLNEKMSMIVQQQQMQGMMQRTGEAIAAAAGQPNGNADPNNKALAKVPGQSAPPQVAEGAAESQGNDFAQGMGA